MGLYIEPIGLIAYLEGDKSAELMVFYSCHEIMNGIAYHYSYDFVSNFFFKHLFMYRVTDIRYTVPKWA